MFELINGDIGFKTFYLDLYKIIISPVNNFSLDIHFIVIYVSVKGGGLKRFQ